MTDSTPQITRRRALLSFASIASAAGLNVPANADTATARRTLVLRADNRDRPSLSMPDAPLRRGDEVTVRFENGLDQPAILTFRGLDGLGAAEPLVARQPVAAGGADSFVLSLRSAGTLLADLRLLDSGRAAMPAVPLIVTEAQPPQVDGDQVVLIEDVRPGPDGRPLAPGSDVGEAPWQFTINGKPSADIPVRSNGRFRLRFINACQRNVIAIKIDDHDVRVMALDSQPAEPFPARNGALVMPPGSRIDTFIDAVRPPGSRAAITLHDGSKPIAIGNLVYTGEPPVRPAPLPLPPPLPDNALPAQLPFEGALRTDLPIGALAPSQMGWFAPDKFAHAAGPAFTAKRGRIVVLAIANRATTPFVFRMHGHHFRLLDRLDDGWKPFWLDTLAIDAGQTQRIAFAAEYPGLWLMEAFAAKWSAPLLLRSYLVS